MNQYAKQFATKLGSSRRRDKSAAQRSTAQRSTEKTTDAAPTSKATVPAEKPAADPVAPTTTAAEATTTVAEVTTTAEATSTTNASGANDVHHPTCANADAAISTTEALLEEVTVVGVGEGANPAVEEVTVVGVGEGDNPAVYRNPTKKAPADAAMNSSKPKKQATLLAKWLVSIDPGNTSRMEKNKRKEIERSAGTYDEEWQMQKAKKMKIANDFFDMVNAPLVRTDVCALLEGMCAAVEFRKEMDDAEPTKVRAKLSGSVAESEKALQIMIAKAPDRVETSLRGASQRVLGWHERSAAAYIFLHLRIYGKLDFNSKVQKVATVLGVNSDTVRKWFSLHDKLSTQYMESWVPIVKDMTWKQAATHFSSRWAAQWNIPEDEKVVDRMGPYLLQIAGNKTVLSKFTPGTTTAGRKSAAKRNANTFVMKQKSKQVPRVDAGKARKHQLQEEFVKKLVVERWDFGDPIGKAELTDELRAMDECAEEYVNANGGKNFYESYLDPKKGASGLSNWVSRVLDRMGWSLRKNSIGQIVPPDWREQAEANAAELRNKFREANVDVMLNADQTFVNFYPEESVVVAPTGTNRVGGRVKADVKAGFTAMVSCNMLTSKMDPPFVVYNGMKLKDAQRPETTLAWKHRNWRNSALGRTGYMAFQKKHWFDGDITVEWFEWVLNILYPGQKVGISIDMAPCQTKKEVKEYIEKKEVEGRLVVGYINGGLTSVLQVCDLVANKEFKAEIKRLYMRFRAEYLKAERAKTPDEPMRRIKIKIQVVKMTEIVEQSVKTFNDKQCGNPSIRNTFKKAGQHPWEDCEEDFKAHLDALEKLPLYKNETSHAPRIMENNINARSPTVIGDTRADGDEMEQDEELEEAAAEQADGDVEVLGSLA